MPKYEFECNKCKNIFEIFMSLKEKENKKVICPECKAEDINQVFFGFNLNNTNAADNAPDGCCGGSGCC